MPDLDGPTPAPTRRILGPNAATLSAIGKGTAVPIGSDVMGIPHHIVVDTLVAIPPTGDPAAAASLLSGLPQPTISPGTLLLAMAVTRALFEKGAYGNQPSAELYEALVFHVSSNLSEYWHDHAMGPGPAGIVAHMALAAPDTGMLPTYVLGECVAGPGQRPRRGTYVYFEDAGSGFIWDLNSAIEGAEGLIFPDIFSVPATFLENLGAERRQRATSIYDVRTVREYGVPPPDDGVVVRRPSIELHLPGDARKGFRMSAIIDGSPAPLVTPDGSGLQVTIADFGNLSVDERITALEASPREDLPAILQTLHHHVDRTAFLQADIARRLLETRPFGDRFSAQRYSELSAQPNVALSTYWKANAMGPGPANILAYGVLAMRYLAVYIIAGVSPGLAKEPRLSPFVFFLSHGDGYIMDAATPIPGPDGTTLPNLFSVSSDFLFNPGGQALQIGRSIYPGDRPPWGFGLPPR